MVFNCSICSVTLEKGPGEAPNEAVNSQSNLSAAPCGHIFHTFCINKWIGGGMATSNRCPCCRKPIANKCIPIFPDSYEESFSETPAGASSAVRVIECNHVPQISTLELKVRAVNTELEETKQLYKLLSDDYQNINEKLRQERTIGQSYAMKYKQCESYKDLYNEITKRVTSLEETNKKYEYIDSILNGVKYESKEDMKNFRINESSIHTLIELKHLLQNELESSRRHLETCKRDNESYRSQSIADELKMKELRHDLLELQKVNRDLRRRLVSETKADSPVVIPGPSSSCRRNVGKKLDSTIIIDDDENDKIDIDVGILTPFQFTKTTSRKRAFRVAETITKPIPHSKLLRSTSYDHTVRSKLNSASSPLKNKDSASTLFLSGRSNVPGVAPISPLNNNKNKSKCSTNKKPTK